MPGLTENHNVHAIGMLEAELVHNFVARHCGVHQNTIESLLMCIRQSGNTRNRQRSIRTQNKHIRPVPDAKSQCKKHRRITINKLSNSPHIRLGIVTSGYDVQQSIQCYCLGIV